MPVLAGRGSNLAKHTYESKINLAEGGPDFASFAKFGDKIANLATLKSVSVETGFVYLAETRVAA